MPKRATNPLSDARWPSTRAPSRSLTGSLPPAFALSHICPHARPSVHPSVHPPAPVYPLSLSSLSRFPRTAVFRLAFSFRPFGPRTDVRSVTRTRAFLFRHLPRATPVLPAPRQDDVRCVRCAALHIRLCASVRSALCARPCPARRGAARLGAPRRQVDDAMYIAQTVCNDGNRLTPLLSRIRISFHGQRRRQLRKRSR